jgi:hypothetical protein
MSKLEIMDQSFLEYALRLAEGARAKLAEDRKRLEELRTKQDQNPIPVASVSSLIQSKPG